MDSEHLDLDEITEARRKALRESLESIDAKQLEKLADVIFPYHDHPWKEKLTEFISQNAFGTFHYAKTHDHLQVVYSYEHNKGIWFQGDRGMGILSPRSLQVMREVVTEG